jgi:hypothetical protein
MVEHPAHNGSVTGSTPVGSTEKKKKEKCMSSSKRREMIEDVREYGPVLIIRDYIHDPDARDLFRAFAIATTERLSDDDFEALIEEIIDIFDDEDEEFEE